MTLMTHSPNGDKQRAWSPDGRRATAKENQTQATAGQLNEERNPVYVEAVLRPDFAFARERLLRYILEVDVAHVIMLMRCEIVPAETARALLRVIGPMMESPEETAPAVYDPRFEDLFFMIEECVARDAGDEAAGSMHVALSRNDLDTAIFRMAARDRLIELGRRLDALRRTLLDVAERERATVMPAYTHNQQAQPTTFGHYLAAVEAVVARDGQRLIQAWPRTNLSPLGAAALAGTGFPVDREWISASLGFEGLVENTYDAVSSADYALELAGICSGTAGDLSRFVCDLMFWATNEVGVLRLDDAFIQVSSIMPQKRNPVALEHTRALLGKAIAGEASGRLLLHNVPFGDVNDAGVQLQPIVHEQCSRLREAVALLGEVLATMKVDQEVLKQRAIRSFATSTELADTLVRRDRLPFRLAHRVVSRLAARLSAAGRVWSELALSELEAEVRAVTGGSQGTSLTSDELQAALDPLEFVARRRVPGGPAEAVLGEYLKRRRQALSESTAFWDKCEASMKAYRERLSREWRKAVQSQA
ncbi:MAG: argininosuccinate lyase [Firmicutes bacterium]|jgi:argininosuccinate lyase|nr:argininosuccinate lyase [Bacillota bacterium]MDH7494838.1 argininosuccinate lyase [Bacillota bacterium]